MTQAHRCASQMVLQAALRLLYQYVRTCSRESSYRQQMRYRVSNYSIGGVQCSLVMLQSTFFPSCALPSSPAQKYSALLPRPAPLASLLTRPATIPSAAAPAAGRSSMASASSSVAGPSAVAFSAAALPSASGLENGSGAAATGAGEAGEGQTAAPPSTAATSNGNEHDNDDMSIDTTSNNNTDALLAVVEDAPPSTAAPSTASASSSNPTAGSTATAASSLPTPTTAEPPLSAPAAPPSSSDGRKTQRAAKVKANAMVALNSDGLEGSLSASEGPGTPVLPNTAPLSRAKRQRNVKFRWAQVHSLLSYPPY